MNRVRQVLIGLAGSTAAGVGIVVSLLQPGESLHVSCPQGTEDVCTIMARPAVSQCPSLGRMGGDFLGPYEQGDEHALGRVLQALRENDTIITWHTWGYVNTPNGPDFSQCEVEVKLTREQARQWNQALTEVFPEDGPGIEAPALLNSQPLTTSQPRASLAGDDQTGKTLEHFDLMER